MKWCQKGGSCRAAALPQCYPNLPKTRLSQINLYSWYRATKVRRLLCGVHAEDSFIQTNRQMTDNDENLILWSHNSHWNVWNSGIEKREARKTLNPGWLQEACWEVCLHFDTNFPLLVPCFLCLKKKKVEFTQDKWEQLITGSYSFYVEN